jgi:HD-GYP domain-containing protein (c-di-GMP phosphodiesterase class II)
MRQETINNIIKDIDKKYSYEKEHRETVAKLSKDIAKKLLFDENRLEEVERAALVHDVGKIKVSEKTLNKKEKLSKEEWEELKRHPVIGYNIFEGC